MEQQPEEDYYYLENQPRLQLLALEAERLSQQPDLAFQHLPFLGELRQVADPAAPLDMAQLIAAPLARRHFTYAPYHTGTRTERSPVDTYNRQIVDNHLTGTLRIARQYLIARDPSLSEPALRFGTTYGMAAWSFAGCQAHDGTSTMISRIQLQGAELYATIEHYLLTLYVNTPQPRPMSLLLHDGTVVWAHIYDSDRANISAKGSPPGSRQLDDLIGFMGSLHR